MPSPQNAANDANAMPRVTHVEWLEDGSVRRALWHSEGGWPAPRDVRLIDERMLPQNALRLAAAGTGLLWTGDYHAAKRMLSAVAEEHDRSLTRGQKRDARGSAARGHTKRTSSQGDSTPLSPAAPSSAARGLTAAFHRHRDASFERARVLGALLIPLNADHAIPLDRAPDVRAAAAEAYGDPISRPASAESPSPATPTILALREMLGVIGAHEWRERGVPIAALGGARIHPHYGVFSPVRGEYLDLVASAPLPPGALEPAGRAFDIGTGTGVLAAILAGRSIPSVIGTDQDPRAIACARDNLERLGLGDDRVQVEQRDLFPPGRADLVVCNPPWLPAPARVGTDHAVYDPDSRMLRGFLAGLPEHLAPAGEGWLIISDLAERLGLRTRGELLDLIEDAGLTAVGRLDARPAHARVADTSDPLHQARAGEVTSLWRLAHA